MVDLEKIKENRTTELKSAQEGLPRSVFETFSSFANTVGGDIYLGIEEVKRGENVVWGLKDPDKMKEDLCNCLRDSSLISACRVSEDDMEIISWKGKSVLRIHVDEMPRNEKPVYLKQNMKLSYIRVDDGDRVATDEELREMVADSSKESYDLKGNALSFSYKDVCQPTLREFRKKVMEYRPDFYLKEASDHDFLCSIGALINQSGEEVLTNAGVVFFTDYLRIVRLFPHYYLDYRRAESISSKWSDRLCSDELIYSGNMFDFYLRATEKIIPSLPHPYIAQDGINKGPALLQEAVKEAFANALSNYAYVSDGSLLLLQGHSSLTFKNAGRTKVGLAQALKGGKSDPRNPGVQLFFRLLGVADRAGTGIPEIYSVMAAADFVSPYLGEDAFPEETTLILSFTPKNIQDKKDVESKYDVYAFLMSKGEAGASAAELAEALSLSRPTVLKLLRPLLEQGKIYCNDKPTAGRRYFAV